jgi:hypothetical protein
MRDNGRPALLASTTLPSLLMMYPGTRPVVACPDCGTWRVPRRGMLPAHRTADEHSRCPGSGQRVTIDLTPVQWMESLRVRGTGSGRATRHDGPPQREFARPAAGVPAGGRPLASRRLAHSAPTGSCPAGAFCFSPTSCVWLGR